VIRTRGRMVNLKMIMAAAVIGGACSFTALGWGVGMANAVPISPVPPVTTWPQDPGHGHGHGHGGDDWGGDGGGPWYGGPGWYGAPGISACVSATGPWGYVTGSACI
jgi:hypothetical protein